MIHFILALQTCSCYLGRNMWRRELYLDQAVVTGQHRKPNLTFIDLKQHHSISSDKLHRWAQIRKADYQGFWHCRYARYVNRWCGLCSGSWDTAEIHFLDTGRKGSLTNRAQTVGNQNPSCGFSWAMGYLRLHAFFFSLRDKQPLKSLWSTHHMNSCERQPMVVVSSRKCDC